MPPRSRVGKSGVTPCKHDLLNKLLGREAGTLKANPLGISSYKIVDLTAGDGQPYQNQFEKGCSPGICLKHVNWICENTKAQGVYIGIEKQAATFANLASAVQPWLIERGWQEYNENFHFKGSSRIRLYNANSTEADVFSVSAPGASIGSFLYNDPNHIEDWCLTPELLRSAPTFTTSLSTLGCNVGGLKRIDLDRRREWFYRVELISETILQGWHDACLLAVGGADQWAYLITAPAKWRDRITQDCITAATKIQGREAEPRIAWRKQDPAAFYQLERFLFLTKQEFNDGHELV